MKECRPGMRLLVETPRTLRPATLSAVLRDGNHGLWGITAGHFLDELPDEETVWYFPESLRTALGRYSAPAARGDGEDLARFRVRDEAALSIPVGFGRVPKLISADALDDITGEDLLFLGGQVGKVSAQVERIAQFESHPGALYVRLQSSSLITGDSGGPLYFDEGSELLWVGTLLAGRSKDDDPGITEGIFLPPHRGLARLGFAI